MFAATKKERRQVKMKRIIALLLVTVMILALAACAVEAKDTKPTEPTPEPDTTSEPEPEPTPEPTPEPEPVNVRVASLKGPTTMGLVALMDKAERGETFDAYTFDMETDASVVAASVIAGDVDIALIPANLAAVLYKRTEGGIAVVDINTLGVLYCVTGDASIKSVKDLAGKTVVLTGQGTTPEYALRYLLEKNGVTDCELEFKSEATEVAATLAADPTRIAVLPQPFATVAQVQNTELHEAFSLTDEWDAVSDDSRMLTGVTVVRKAFLNENPLAVERFIAEHAASASAEDADKAALIVKYGIIEKEPVANKALPKCGIVCIYGEEMKSALSGYLGVLFAADTKAVGGELPGDDFYYVG